MIGRNSIGLSHQFAFIAIVWYDDSYRIDLQLIVYGVNLLTFLQLNCDSWSIKTLLEYHNIDNLLSLSNNYPQLW